MAAPLGALGLALTVAFFAAPLPRAQAQGATVNIEMTERGNQWIFMPNEITVPAGTVRLSFRNSGARAHNFVVEALDQRIPDVNAGASFDATLIFTRPGTYEFICDLPLHAARGMKGTLTVTAAPQAQATTAPAAATAPAAGAGTAAASPTALRTPTAAAGQAAAPAAGSGAGAGSGATAGQSGLSAAPRSLPLFISLAIHIPTVITWLGIVLYDAIVVAVPFLTPAQKGGLLHRPRWLVLLTIPIFTATGIYQTIYNPFTTVTDFASLEAFRASSPYGFALFLKHGFVIASVALTLGLTFWVAPRLVAFADDVRDSAATPPRLPALVSWANVAACAALLLCVAVMVFQLH